MTVTQETEQLWLRGFRRDPAGRIEVVFLPHAGGSAGFFRKLAESLPSWIDTSAVQYPGRQDRRGEPAVDSIPVLARRIADVLSARDSGPVALFGHSMGAVLAFEIARIVQQRPGHRIAGVIASGRRAPSVRRTEEVRLGDDSALIAELATLGGTQSEFLRDRELWEMVAPSVRADYRAIQSYEYRQGAVLNCPLSVLVGRSDPRVSLTDARAWQPFTDNGFRFRVFPGGHFYLAEPTTRLSAAIAEDLAWFASDHTRRT